jgi:hypothetical protein
MRTITEDTVTPQTKKSAPQSFLKTFSTKLSDGRVITIREMTGRDLLYIEKELTKAGDVERGTRIIERLCVGDEKITFDEVLDLPFRDYKKISELVAKAGDEEETEDPN